MEFLASDAMGGRKSGSQDELKAAKYIGEQLKAYGIQPAGDLQGYVQKAPLTARTIILPPSLRFIPPGATTPTIFKFGKDFLAVDLVDSRFSGPLQKVSVDADGDLPHSKNWSGHIDYRQRPQKNPHALSSYLSSSAVAILIPARNDIKEEFQRKDEKFPELPSMFAGQTKSVLGGRFDGLSLSADAMDALSKLPAGTIIRFRAPVTVKPAATWNAVGMIVGSDPSLQNAAILFSAHLDHVGVGKPVNGDSIYNGADDNASGCAAVMEIARAWGSGTKPKRTVIFALFGSEEVGGTGSTYFRSIRRCR